MSSASYGLASVQEIKNSSITMLFEQQSDRMQSRGIRQWGTGYAEKYGTDYLLGKISNGSRIYVRRSPAGIVDAAVLVEDCSAGSDHTEEMFENCCDLPDNIADYAYASHLAKQEGSKNVMGLLLYVKDNESKNGTAGIICDCVDNETTSLFKYYTRMGFSEIARVPITTEEHEDLGYDVFLRYDFD